MLLSQTFLNFALAVGLASALADLGPVKEFDRRQPKTTKCIIAANGDGSDDSPAILEAFDKCKSNGHIVFENTTYYIDKVMNTTELDDVKIDIKGTLLVSHDQTNLISL